MSSSNGLLNLKEDAWNSADRKQQLIELVTKTASAIIKTIKDKPCFVTLTDETDLSIDFINALFEVSIVTLLLKRAPGYTTCQGSLLVASNLQQFMALFSSWHNWFFSENNNRNETKNNGVIVSAAIWVVLRAKADSVASPWRIPERSLRGSQWVAPLLVTGGEGGEPARARLADLRRGRWASLEEAPQLDADRRRRLRRWPDLRRERIIVPVADLHPYVYGDGDGVDMKIIETLAEKLNDNMSTIPIQSERPWPILVRMLTNREVNISGGFVMTNRFKFEQGIPSDTGCASLLVPEPLPLRNRWVALLEPLQRPVWIAAAVALLAVGLTMDFLVKAQPRFGVADSREVTSASGLLEALGVLMATACPPPFPAPRPITRRCLLLAWSLAGVLLVTAYCCGLLSHLTAPHFARPVDSLQELIDAGMAWGSTLNLRLNVFFVEQTPLHEEMKRRFIHVKSPEEQEARLASRRFAVLGNDIGGKFCPLGAPPEKKSLLRLRVMRETIRCDGFALSYPTNSQLRPWGDKLVQSLSESGLVDYWLRKTLRRRVAPAILGVRRSVGDEWERPGEIGNGGDSQSAPAKPLQLAHFYAVFALLSVGGSAAIVVFLAEMTSMLLSSILQKPEFPKKASKFSTEICMLDVTN